MRKKNVKNIQEKKDQGTGLCITRCWLGGSQPQNTGHLASQNGMESKSFKKKHTVLK